MSQVNGDTPASPKDALPVITFSEDISFYLNGHDTHVSHQRNTHTDGDTLYILKIQMLFMPEICSLMVLIHMWMLKGTLDGIIAGVNRVLGLVDEQAKIIPGHGPLPGKKELYIVTFW